MTLVSWNGFELLGSNFSNIFVLLKFFMEMDQQKKKKKRKETEKGNMTGPTLYMFEFLSIAN